MGGGREDDPYMLDELLSLVAGKFLHVVTWMEEL